VPADVEYTPHGNHKWVKLKSYKRTAKPEGEARAGIKSHSLHGDFLAFNGLININIKMQFYPFYLFFYPFSY